MHIWKRVCVCVLTLVMYSQCEHTFLFSIVKGDFCVFFLVQLQHNHPRAMSILFTFCSLKMNCVFSDEIKIAALYVIIDFFNYLTAQKNLFLNWLTCFSYLGNENYVCFLLWNVLNVCYLFMSSWSQENELRWQATIACSEASYGSGENGVCYLLNCYKSLLHMKLVSKYLLCAIYFSGFRSMDMAMHLQKNIDP